MIWKTVKLKDVCIIQPPKKEAKQHLDNNAEVSFMGMDLLGIDKMYANTEQIRTLSDVYSGYTFFAEDDVLLAKITPCFENGKLGIAKGLKNRIGFGSSEFIVFRCSKYILPEFLYHFLNQERFRNKGSKNMSGAVGHRRVMKEFIANTLINLPPLEIQKRIIAKLNGTLSQINSAIKKCSKQIEESKKLYKSLIDQIYFSNNSVPLVEVKKIAEIKGGKRLPKGKKLLTEKTKFPYLRVSDFNEEGGIDEQNIRYINKEIQEEISRYTISSNDVYVSIAGTIGKTGIIPPSLDNANLTENAAKIVLNEKCDRDFFYYFTTSLSFDKQAIAQTRKTAQPKLALERLAHVKLPLHELTIQKEIAKKAKKSRDIISMLGKIYSAKILKLNLLKKVILERELMS